MISQAHVWLCDPLSHPNYDINYFYCEIVEMQLNYLTLADKDQLSTLSRFSNSSRSMWDMTLPALFVSLLSLASLLRSSFQLYVWPYEGLSIRQGLSESNRAATERTNTAKNVENAAKY